MKLRTSICAAGILTGAVFMAAGCWQNANNSPRIIAPEEQMNPGPKEESTPAQRVQAVSERLRAYTKTAKELPASTEFLQRAMLEEIFADLSSILPPLEGPDADAIFRQQLHIVQSTREQLVALPADQSSETIVETGLRAAYDALDDMTTTLFSDNADLPDALNALSTRLDDMDTTQGTDSRQVEADSARMIGEVAVRMNDALAQRLLPATAPTTAPATQPTTTPATQAALPATNPS